MKYEWIFDETKQIGIDYTDIKQVQYYDSNMQKLRDIKKENKEILKDINIAKDHTIVEFGTGTGEFALEAAKYCSKVIAVDISKEMLRYAEMKAKSRNIKNIEFCNGGFLTYEHKAGNIDSVISQLALHHLPDFWKMIALKRIYDMLKDEGKFYLKDVVYSFEIDNYIDFFNGWVEKIKNTVGVHAAREAEVTVRDEYATAGWIMEELIKRSGFEINKVEYQEGFIATYICTKVKK